MSEKLIHYRPLPNNTNVRCLNGDYHRKEASRISEVTCPKCKNPSTSKDYWKRKILQSIKEETEEDTILQAKEALKDLRPMVIRRRVVTWSKLKIKVQELIEKYEKL